MLCEICQTTIGAAFGQGRRRNLFPLFYAHQPSLMSLYSSISAGCFICRQISISIISRQQQSLAPTTTLDPTVLDGPSPDDYEELRRQVQQIQSTNLLFRPPSSSFRRRMEHKFVSLSLRYLELLPTSSHTLHWKISLSDWSSRDSVTCFSILNSTDHRRVTMYIGLSPAGDCEFLLWPSPKESNSSGISGEPHFEIGGKSTGAMPQVWRHWFLLCSKSHALCHSLWQEQTFSPDRLIEILVDIDNKDKIRWRLGLSQHIKLTKATYPSFLAFCTDLVLPKTYRDAFRVTASLGFRFIWIDSLCIIQDDQDDWRTQSSMMGAVYREAACNIAATWASDGDQGCFRQRDPSLMTTSKFITHPGSVEYTVSLGNTYEEDITNAPLNTRGWVVQERYLARKQLSFTKNQVYWECPELIASEQFPAGLPGNFLAGVDDGFLRVDTHQEVRAPGHKPRVNFEDDQKRRQAWSSVVERYSSCFLTRSSDKMIAMAGLASELRDMTNDVYLAGLWKTDAHKQLCWKVPRDDRQHHRYSSYYAPTWSWASINGPVWVDPRYHEPSRKALYLVEVVDALTESGHPFNLHSLKSAELRVRAIAIPVRLGPDGFGFGNLYPLKLLGQPATDESPYHRPLAAFIEWDKSPSLQANALRFDYFDDERNSDLLFLCVVAFLGERLPELSFGLEDSVVDDADESNPRLPFRLDDPRLTLEDIVLKKQSAPEREGHDVFARLGTFQIVDLEFIGILDERVNSQLSKAGLMGDTINLGDSRLADLVHSVAII